MNIKNNISELIGNTPLLKLNSLENSNNNILLGKCEFMNPTSSIKDRIAKTLINDGIKRGLIDKETTIIEPTSGNTGIGLASICASKGLKLILTMPDSMSLERRELLKALGAKVELTKAEDGMIGSIQKAEELSKTIPNSYIPKQFENPANIQAHQNGTALEILKDLDGKIDIYVSAIGTGGTLMGIAKTLKGFNPDIKIIAVEPYNSPILSGGKAGLHKIQGIGANFIPKIVDLKYFDEIIKIKDEDAIKMAKNIANKEGLLVGISSGANLVALEILSNRYSEKTIVTTLCDSGERYISSGLYS